MTRSESRKARGRRTLTDRASTVQRTATRIGDGPRGSSLSIALLVLQLSAAMASADETPWRFQAYLDAGYAHSTNQPDNQLWRTKGTTRHLDDPELFLSMADVRKESTPDSRWGFDFGLQAGLDSEDLVPGQDEDPIANADEWRHLYRANVSYLFDAGRGVRLTAGLLESYIGHESYLAIDNPNYTRGYLADYVPFFLTGVEVAWDVSESVDLSFYLVSGFNHLASPNDVPSTGMQLEWSVSDALTVTQNLFHGPDQAETSLEFWRFFSDTIVTWETGRFTLAGALDLGTEKQAALPGQPRYDWAAAAIWTEWRIDERWSLAFRPEAYWDDDGLLTGARQALRAFTATARYTYEQHGHRLVANLELRFDRSTGDEGGFYRGSDNRLVPDQSLLIAGLLWSFEI